MERTGFRYLRARESLDGTDLCMAFFIGKHILQGRDDGLLEGCILPLGPPISDLRHPGAAEMLLQGLIVTLVGREEGEKVFDTSFA